MDDVVLQTKQKDNSVKCPVKISEFSLGQLKSYASTYGIVVPKSGLSKDKVKEFYVAELTKLNNGEDAVSDGGKASTGNNSSIVCSVCKERKAVRKEVYQKRIVVFGSEENLLKNYKCLNCRRKH